MKATFRKTDDLVVDAEADWTGSIAKDDDGHAVVEVESGITYNDLTATMRIAKPSDAWFEYNSSSEWINGAKDKDGDFAHATPEIKQTLPAEFNKEDSLVYGSKTFKFGFWVFDGERLLFRPNNGNLATMPPGTKVESVLGLNIVKGANGEILLKTSWFRVTLLSIVPILSFSMENYTVGEPEGATSNATLTVNISRPLVDGKSVDVFYETVEIPEADTQPDEDPAKSGSDFTGTGNTIEAEKITFAEGDTNQTISIPILDDPNNERNEVFQVKLLQPGMVNGETIAALHGGASEISTKITIEDAAADGFPEFILNDDTVDEGTGTYNLPVRLSGTTFEAVTVEYELLTTSSATKGTDATNGDFMLPGGSDSGSLQIDAGTIETILPVTLFDDTMIEGSETITIKFDNPMKADLPNNATVKEITITIGDNDRMSIISVDTSPLQEGEANPMITVNLVPPATTDDISIDYVVSAGANGTATEGADGDFIMATGTLMFDDDDGTANINNSSATIPLTIIDDLNYELAETIEVSLSNLQGTNVQLSMGQTSLTETITINEETGELKPQLSIPERIEVWEDVPHGTVTIPVSLTGTTYESITVEIETSSTGLTSLAGTDYNIHRNTVVTIPAGKLTYDIELSNVIIDNRVSGGDKKFKIIIRNATNAGNALTTTPLETTVTIKDDENLPTLEFAAGTGIVADEDVGNLVVRVVSSRVVSSTENLTMNYRIPSGGTATAGSDFMIPTATSFQIQHGKMVGEFEIPILTDTDSGEGDEKFKIILEKPQALSTSANLRLKGGANELELEITIRDVAGRTPTLSFEVDVNNEIVVNDNVANGLLTVTVLLSLAADVMVNYKTEDVPGEAKAGMDYTAISGNFEIKGGATKGTFDISIANITGAAEKIFNVVIDTADLSVRLQGGGNTTVPDGNGGQRVALSQKVKIVNADRPATPTITIDEPSGPVTESNGATLQYDFTLSNAIEEVVTIAYSISSESTVETSDYIFENPSPLRINQGSTTVSLVIRVENDSLYEGDETIILKLASTNAVFSADTRTHTLTSVIADDEELPVLSIKDTIQSVSEGTATTVSVISSVQPETALSVQFTATNTDGDFFDTATSSSSPKTMTFEPQGSEFVGELTIGTKKNYVAGQTTGVISVNLDTPGVEGGYRIDNTAATATVKVVDESEYVISIMPDSASVIEGEEIEVTFRSDPEPEEEFDVRMRITQTGDNLIWPVKRNVRFTRNRRTVSMTLNTVGNPESAINGVVSVEVLDSDDYVPGKPISVEVRKPDQVATESAKYSVVSSVITEILQAIPPTPPQGESRDAKPTLSIRTEKGIVDEGELAVFAISASHEVSSSIPIKIKLSETGDFINGPMDRTVYMKTELSETEFAVATDNDALAEADGRITATIQADSEYFVGSHNTAHVTVSDALDRQQRKTSVSTALNTVLPDLLAHSTARTLDIANNRVTHGFSGNSSTSIELNGRSPALTALQSGGEMLNGSGTDWRSIIDDSSFTLALYPEGGEKNLATVWGVGDKWSLASDGYAEQQAWDGETHTGHFGFDARVGQGVLAGLAMSVSQSEINYGQSGDSGMSFDTMATGFHPYLGITTADGNSQLQVMAGFGENELELKQEEYLPEFLNGRFHTVGLSGRNRLYSNDNFGGLHNFELNVSGEAWHSRQFVNPVDGVVDNLQVEARHVRIAVEGAHDFNLATSGKISPSISIGLLEEGRNDKSFSGLDAGSVVGYQAYASFEIVGSGKVMSFGLNRVHKWNIDGSVDYDSGNDGKGILFKMSPSWSSSNTDVKRHKWLNELPGVSGNSFDSSVGAQLAAEIGYGFEVLDSSSVLTPFHSLRHSSGGNWEFQLGNRIATNSGIDVEFVAIRESSGDNTSEHELSLNGNISW